MRVWLSEEVCDEVHDDVAGGREPEPRREDFLVLGGEVHDREDRSHKYHGCAPQAQGPCFRVSESGHVEDDLRSGDGREERALGHEDDREDPDELAVYGESPDERQQEKVDDNDPDELVKAADRVLGCGEFLRQDPEEAAEHVACLGDEEGQVHSYKYDQYYRKQYLRYDLRLGNAHRDISLDSLLKAALHPDGSLEKSEKVHTYRNREDK